MPRFTLLCLVLVGWGVGCSQPAQQKSASPGGAKWATTMPVSFRPRPVASASPTTAPAPQREPRTLDQIIASLSPTPEQRGSTENVVTEAQQQWQSWLTENIPQLQSTLKEVEDAAHARDRDKLIAAQDKWNAAIKDMPRTRTTWQKIHDSFTPEQRQQLDKQQADGFRSLSGTLHASVRPITAQQKVSDAGRCIFCHLPHYEIK
jgi:Spy/CpxP family protein refolding chaperone